ncbi:MAG TPA: ABC transporter ATP-binding protein [Rubrivivax sp.]|nr:ABC transporter ATP-binding protein [Rubrivivax sp.]
MGNAPVLEIANLSIGLPQGSDRPNAVSHVSLSVAPGEIVCLVGESGSGKSVIAFATMGLLPKNLPVREGSRIALQGEDLVKVPESRLRELRCTRMGMIFQEPMTALNPVMRCGAQIDEVLAEHTPLPAAERKARIIAMIEQVHLPDPARMVESFPHQLSGGQRQRIMIAMALILEPVLLIADEPTTALDVTTQAQTLKLIKELQTERGTGVLFITHDFGVVAEIADRVAVLKHGELVEIGPTEQLLKHPQHAYTRMLIRSVPGHEPPARMRPAPLHEPVVLSAHKLFKTYGHRGLFGGHTVAAVRDVAFEIRRGETLGIVGESGSGKSTVARCVARLIDPSEGRIMLAGTDIAAMPAGQLRGLRRKIQIIFQDPYRSLNPRRTVGQSIVEGPMNYGASAPEAWARARRLMELVRLDPDSLDRYPHQFSGGQRQRICIARALAMEPELLIADEAVSALDVSVQAQVLQLLGDIRDKLNLAMLFITHDLRVAAQVCDDVAVMSKGRIVEYGPAQQIFGSPQHAYTRALFEAAPGRHFDFAKAGN